MLSFILEFVSFEKFSTQKFFIFDFNQEPILTFLV